MNADGVVMDENTNSSGEWPFFLSIAKVHPDKRRESLYNIVVTILPKKSSKLLFQSVLFLIAEELEILQDPDKAIISDSYKVNFHLLSIVCDLPARAKVLLQKAHNGRFSCVFCEEKGKNCVTNKRKIVFPFKHSNLRTKASIVKNIIEKKKGFFGEFCQLFRISCFTPNLFTAIDLMHLILEGIAKKLFKELTLKSSPFYCEKFKRNTIEKNISLIKLAPNWHHVMPTSLKKISALQSLFVIVYGTGCFTCVGEDFMSLMNGIKEIVVLALKPEINVDDMATIRSMCNNFLAKYQQLMGEKYMTHNLHLLKHLYRDIYLLGPSWTHIMFQFEGFNHDINKLQTSRANFYKRIILNYNEQCEAESMIKKIIENNPPLKFIYDQLQKLREKSCPYERINGFCFPRRRGQYSNYAKLINGKVGEIVFKEAKTNQNLQIFFKEIDMNNLGRNHHKIEIKKEEIEKQVIVTRKLFMIDEDDFQLVFDTQDVLNLKNFL